MNYIASLQESMDLLPAEAVQAIDGMLSRLGNLSPISSASRPVTFLLCGLSPEILLFIILTILGIFLSPGIG